MKKITLLITLLFASFFNANSQVLLSENFDTALNWTVAHPVGTSTNAGWTRVTTGTSPTTVPAAGAGFARFNSYNINPGVGVEQYDLTSPSIAFAGASYRVTLKMYRDGAYPTLADKIEVFYNTTATSVGGTLLGTVNRALGLAPVVASNGWYDYSLNVSGTPTGAGFISILGTSTYGNNIFIDEVIVEVVPACANPTILTSSAITTTTATISWTAPASAPANGYEYFLSTTNTAPIATTIPTGSIAAGVVTKSLTGLSANTPYYYWVRSKCSASLTSTWSSGSFTTLPIPPSNDECSTALPVTVNPLLTCTTSTAGTVLGATASAVPNTTCFGNANDDVWFSFVATQTSHAISLTNVSGFTDMYHSLYSGTCSTLTLVPASCRDADTGTETGLTIGSTYYIRVYSYSATPQTATFNVCVGTVVIIPPPVNDDCTTATNLTVGGTFASNEITSTSSGATTTAGLVATCQGLTIADVWFSVTVPASGTLTLETDAPNPVGTSTVSDTVMSVFSGTCAGTLTSVGCDDDAGNGNFSKVVLTGQTPGSILKVAVWQYDNSSFGTPGTGAFKISAYDASLPTTSFNNEGFSYYPNPVVDILRLSYTQNIDKVEVMNMLGQVVLNKTINANESNIDMSSLAKGTYMVKVVADNQIKTIKVIKE